MPDPTITVYGAYWCPDCRRAKKFLGEQLVSFNWVDIEQEPQAEQYVVQKNHGKRIIPLIEFTDGSFVVEPTNAELARKLGLQTEAKQAYYELVIVGGGPAGLTGAIYAAREGIDTLLIERSGLGGQAAITGGIENFPGFPEGISGGELAERMTRQARRFGVEILQAQEVSQLCNHDGYHCVMLAGERHIHAQTVLIATGARYRRLGIPGEEDFIGAGVHFCATCDGPFYKGAKEIVVVGGGNSAIEEGLHLTKFAEKVIVLVRGEKLAASRILNDQVSAPGSRLEVHYHTVVEAFEGQNDKLKAVRVRDVQSGETQTLHPAAAFVFIGLDPNSAIVADIVELDEYGYILTGHDLSHGREPLGGREPYAFETSTPGVFAAGDVRHGSTKQVASAVGEGAAAVISIRECLRLAEA